MIDKLIDFLIELAVNPDAHISEETLDQHQITDDELRAALLGKDKHALMRFLDPKNYTLRMNNNGAIFSMSGDVTIGPSDQAADRTLSGDTGTGLSDWGTDVTFVLESEPEFDLTLTHMHKSDHKYKARVVNGKFMGRPVPPAREMETSEEETP